jgi:hypothetical protein
MLTHLAKADDYLSFMGTRGFSKLEEDFNL